jgi:hypothetical protein
VLVVGFSSARLQERDERDFLGTAICGISQGRARISTSKHQPESAELLEERVPRSYAATRRHGDCDSECSVSPIPRLMIMARLMGRLPASQTMLSGFLQKKG